MTRTAAGLALLLGSLALAAQNGPHPDGKTAAPQVHSVPGRTVIMYPDIVACPIDMHATQGVWNRTIKVHDGDKERIAQPFGQRISLNLKDSRPAQIVAATVRVHGLNGKNRMLPTPTDTAQRSNAVRTLRVSFSAEKDGTVSADLRIEGFTSVTSIQLVEVSYSDGSVWTVSGSNACRVQPDPLMLITER